MTDFFSDSRCNQATNATACFQQSVTQRKKRLNIGTERLIKDKEVEIKRLTLFAVRCNITNI